MGIIHLQVFVGQERRASMSAEGEVECGRQDASAGDPEPYRLLNRGDGNRLVLIPESENKYSRKWFAVSCDGAGQTTICNLHDAHQLRLTDGSEIPPGTEERFAGDVTVNLGASRTLHVGPSPPKDDVETDLRFRMLDSMPLVPGTGDEHLAITTINTFANSDAKHFVQMLRIALKVVQQASGSDAFFYAAAQACEQGFRPDFLALERAGYAVAPELGTVDKCRGALVLAGKHKGENHAMIARACRLAGPGGVVAVAGDKTLGITSLRKWASGRAEIEGSLAKHHATVFWFAAPEANAFTDIEEAPRPAEAGFGTAPGMFSHGKADPGSALLAEHFDARISGAVADFGCGWGYLSAHVLEKGRPESLSLYEAHYPSMRAAERNVTPRAGTVPVEAHWLDLTSETVGRRFDWIVMNPPFHAGRSSEPDIGRAFIAAASKALKPGGRLLMVANRKLAYEQALAQGFRCFAEKTVRDGFKVIEALR